LRLLWVSDSPVLHTGYGVTTHEIVSRLHATGQYEIAVLGWYHDAAHYDRRVHPYPLLPGAWGWKPDWLAEVLAEFRPEVLITLGNFSMLAAVQEVPAQFPGRWVGYFPVEGRPVARHQARLIDALDVAVTFTQYAAQEIRRVRPDCKVQVIPLGVDVQTFRPLSNRVELRRQCELENRFVVGCVARNQPRKQLPLLLRAFAQFAQIHEEAFLYLHSDPDDVGWDLVELADRYGIADRVGFTPGMAFVLGVSREELNEIYNLFDVFALPTMGEGFGLPLLEAMAAGVPVVTTDFAGGAELVRGRGELVRVAGWVTEPGHNFELALADEQDFLSRLLKLYARPDLRREYATRGRRFAQTLTWERCAQAWQTLLKECRECQAPTTDNW